jgi:hypothetical protein
MVAEKVPVSFLELRFLNEKSESGLVSQKYRDKRCASRRSPANSRRMMGRFRRAVGVGQMLRIVERNRD